MSDSNLETKEIRVRMAPSPTGYLHVGTARATLFNYLFAKRNKGKFVLRIEDTDLERSKKEYADDIIENLKWLGIHWDEGPGVGGPYAPYFQTERLDIYAKYLRQLFEKDHVYYCFCSEDELEAVRQDQMARGVLPIYNGKCRQIPKEKAEQMVKEGKPSVIRFKTPFRKIKFRDLIRGDIEFDTSLIGDFVIAKDEKTPLYNFAVVVDDFEMKISHVIRGEDHISNTPKQILLQEALGFTKLEYAHLPLILGPDKSKLSKRHGATSINDYKKEGYLPETLINFMVFLGWNPGDEREIFSLDTLAQEFSIEKIQKSGAVFNIKRLEYLNGFYIRQKPPQILAEICLPYFIEAGLIKEGNADMARLEKIVALYQERMKKLSEITELSDFFFKEKIEYNKDLLRWKEMTDGEIKESLDILEDILSKIKEEEFTKSNLEAMLLSRAELMGDRGRLLWPLRVALSGKKASAGPFDIADVLGKDLTIKRVKDAKKIIK